MNLKDFIGVFDMSTKVDVYNNDGIGGGATLARASWGCTAGNLADYASLESYEVEAAQIDADVLQIWVDELPWHHESYWNSDKRHYRVNFELYAFAKAYSEDDAEEQARHMLELFDVAEYETTVEEVY